MAIAASFLFSRPSALFCFICLSVFLHAGADDQIKLKTGVTVTGQVLGVANSSVQVKTKGATLAYSLDLVDSITMVPPAAYTQAQGADPTTTLNLLTPLVQTYQGLKADWLISALSEIADAYSALNQSDKAAAVYAQIDAQFPNSIYHSQAQIGRAQLAFKAGQFDAALTALTPVLTEANKTLVPTSLESRLYAPAFLLAGQINQAQQHYSEALEAYLTVKTIFDQNPALVSQAESLVQKLRTEQPNISVD